MKNLPFNQPMSEHEFESIVPVEILEAISELWQEDEQGIEFAILDGVKFTCWDGYIGHNPHREYNITKIN